MGFRKRESNQEGFGIQRNEKMKAGGSMPKKPRKKAKKKPVVKQQGNLKRQIKKSLRTELLDRINSGELNMSNLTPDQLAIAFGPNKAARILAEAAGAQDVMMTNQQVQDQGQSLTNEQIAMLQAQANADAEANAEAKAKAIADAMANPMGPMMPRDDMMLNPPAQRGAIIVTPEGPMIIDPITGVLMPLPITAPGYGLPPGDGMMQGPRMEDGFFDVMPIPIDPVTGLPFTNQGPTLVPGIEPSQPDNTIRNVESGTMKNGGIKYQGVEKGITKGGKEQFKAGGKMPKKKGKKMNKRKSNRYSNKYGY